MIRADFSVVEPGFGMSEEALAAYREELLALREEYAGQMNLYIGIELDVLGPIQKAEYAIGSVHALEAALAACGVDEQVFVIGGYSVYRDALPLADRLALTEVDAAAEHVDTYFPAFDAAEWQLAARESFPADAQNEQPYAFADYVRKA